MTYAKYADVKPGDKLKADGGFTCLKHGDIREVKMDGDAPFIECCEGQHFLAGQLGSGDELVGLTKV